MKQRLQRVLAHAGIASRRHAAELIKNGKVKVDGRIVTEKGFRIEPDEHKIYVNGRLLPGKEKRYYFLFNKPKNIISTAKDTHGRKKITDFFKNLDARVYPVGRLDRDTTGAVIVTNDGEVAHRLMHPSFEVEKEYAALVSPFLAKKDIEKLKRGIRLEGRQTSPCSIKLCKRRLRTFPGRRGAVYEIKLREGRKRQIKKMFEAVGAKVIELKRVRYAGLKLGHLKEGEFRHLTKEEVKKLKQVVSFKL